MITKSTKIWISIFTLTLVIVSGGVFFSKQRTTLYKGQVIPNADTACADGEVSFTPSGIAQSLCVTSVQATAACSIMPTTPFFNPTTGQCQADDPDLVTAIAAVPLVSLPEDPTPTLTCTTILDSRYDIKNSLVIKKIVNADWLYSLAEGGYVHAMYLGNNQGHNLWNGLTSQIIDGLAVKLLSTDASTQENVDVYGISNNQIYKKTSTQQVIQVTNTSVQPGHTAITIKDSFAFASQPMDEDSIWAISSDNKLVWWNGSIWAQIGNQNAVDKIHVINDTVYGIGIDNNDSNYGKIWRQNNGFITLGNIKDDFEYFTDNDIFSFGQDNNIYHWNGTNWKQLTSGGNLVESLRVIRSANGNNIIYAIGSDRSLQKCTSTENITNEYAENYRNALITTTNLRETIGHYTSAVTASFQGDSAGTDMALNAAQLSAQRALTSAGQVQQDFQDLVAAARSASQTASLYVTAIQDRLISGTLHQDRLAMTRTGAELYRTFVQELMTRAIRTNVRSPALRAFITISSQAIAEANNTGHAIVADNLTTARTAAFATAQKAGEAYTAFLAIQPPTPEEQATAAEVAAATAAETARQQQLRTL
ncbi:MAG: hypothetical protein AAB592_00005, partial [Patescibacteria group bacterium]